MLTIKELVADAEKSIKVISVEEAVTKSSAPDVIFIDLRELKR